VPKTKPYRVCDRRSWVYGSSARAVGTTVKTKTPVNIAITNRRDLNMDNPLIPAIFPATNTGTPEKFRDGNTIITGVRWSGSEGRREVNVFSHDFAGVQLTKVIPPMRGVKSDVV
jgi:hypothetical protein